MASCHGNNIFYCNSKRSFWWHRYEYFKCCFNSKSFLYFGFPSDISGDVWTYYDEDKEIVSGYSGATPLAIGASTVGSTNSDEVVNEVEPNEAASETSENVSSEEPATTDVVEESSDIKETVIKEDNKDNKENVVEAESAKEEVVSETSEDVPVEDSVSGEKEEASPSEDASEEEETK